ncbi:MAG: cobalamin-independent methionine synthase II family protein [Dehalococcoidia bacterium]
MKRSTDRFLTTHVGSLIRPPKVQEYVQALAAGEQVDQQAFEEELRKDVAEVVRGQAEAGVDVISDGEFGKSGWTGYVFQRMAGFESRTVPRRTIGFMGRERAERFAEYYDDTATFFPRSGTAQKPICVGPITYTDAGRAAMQRDVDNFKAALQNVRVEEAFLPVVAPCSIGVDYGNEYYKSDEEFLFAVAEALHEEYKTIVDAGLIVQVDDAILTNLYDQVRDEGKDYRSWVAMNIAALNHGLRGIPEDRVRYHLCWGSWPGPHTSDVPLRDIVDLLLTINAQAYSIEAANPRHEWEWVVWQETKLPDGKILLPGVVSHAISHIEHPELIAQRINRFAGLVGRENVIASTDCGFAQNSRIARQHPTIMWAKLESLAEGARMASAARETVLV